MTESWGCGLPQGDETRTPLYALRCLGSCGTGAHERACHLLHSQPALQHLQVAEQSVATFLLYISHKMPADDRTCILQAKGV
jgi:hypothetical protein